MKIAVIGAGGVGGCFGAWLAQAGHDVQFLARGRHLAAMREAGLRIDSPGKPCVIERPDATDDPAQLVRADIVLVCTKLWDLADTAVQLRHAVGAGTAVVPLQNGVDAADTLGQSIPRENVAAGVAYISAVISEPGTVRQTGALATLRVGALHSAQQPVLQQFVQACTAAGFASDLAPDAQRMVWEKFIALNALSGVTALTRQTVGQVRGDSDLRAVHDASIGEAAALARLSGVALPDGFEAGLCARLDTFPADMRASMAHDLLAGRRLEAPWLCGAVVRRAAAIGLPVPVNATIWAALKPFVDGERP
ncbi:MAG: 2-dehydropantoate 2-reductase [Burkholderiales bacterium]|nr:2-dehydropantoate 2-reductase [Burkholderiales bacterium]